MAHTIASDMPQVPMRWLPFLLATAGGLGCLRPAPGTWGSIGAAILAIPALLLLPDYLWQPVMAGGAVLAFVAGLWACPWAIAYFRRGDPSQVVADEMAGLWVALALVPGHIAITNPWLTVLICLLAFRLFDVVKPWPVVNLERLPGGYGIMTDDVAAGILAGVLSIAVVA